MKKRKTIISDIMLNNKRENSIPYKVGVGKGIIIKISKSLWILYNIDNV